MWMVVLKLRRPFPIAVDEIALWGPYDSEESAKQAAQDETIYNLEDWVASVCKVNAVRV